MLHFGVIVIIVFIFDVEFTVSYDDGYSCKDTICSPKAGDLLIGRESALGASSTCGIADFETYCVVTTGGKSHCKECFSRQEYNPITNPNSHRISNVISRVPSDSDRWWQSENAVHNVSIVLNLETQFQFISTILRFKTFRPAAMYLERSDNFGQTWKPYAYFSNNCPRDYPNIPERPRRTLNDVTCTSVYSQLTPSEGGVVAFMAAPSEMHANLPLFSEERQNLSAITNLRVAFTRLNTLGDMQLENSTAIRRKYYYAMYEWNVWGRCSCYGHATRCKAKSASEITNLEKVYGVCECTHNTAGDNCERCADFHQAKPWQPATRESANACERCECNSHASQCFFNSMLYLASNNVSGGHCYQCQHNTEGPQCEFCKPGYFRHPSFSIDHPQTCQPCNCHADGSKYHESCEQYTKPQENTIAGRCKCKQNVAGDKCDRCRVGFWNFDSSNPDGCQECKCHMLGTLANSGCDQITGMCTCKRFVTGENCDQCLPGYFNLTSSVLGCQRCACSPYGALSPECDSQMGRCRCKTGFTGRDCSQIEDGYFVRPPEQLIDQPGFPVDIPLESPTSNGTYVIVIDIDPKQFGPGEQWTLTLEAQQIGSNCVNRKYTFDVTKDTSKLVIPGVCLEPGKKTYITVHAEQRGGSGLSHIIFTDIILIPDENNVGHYAEYCEGFRELAQQIVEGTADPRQMPKRCEAYFRLPQTHWKESAAVAIPCECNVTGSVTPVCDKKTGQCPCKPGIFGMKCDRCEAYHYHFSSTGCTDCACNTLGSLSKQCDVTTSQCQCRQGIEGRQCDRCGYGYWKFPYCQRCDCNGRSETCDKETGDCLSCTENTIGARCDKCVTGFYGDPMHNIPCQPCKCPGGGFDYSDGCSSHPVTGMVCHCKPGYTGTHCSKCSPNYYGSPNEYGGSCRPCECSGNLPPEGGCDQITGACLKCIHDAEGENCERCKEGFWGDATHQLCQRCSCYNLGTVNGDKTSCDRTTGVCPCLPNVIGPRCFECAQNHFNLTSGKGCEPCACDPTGSLFTECHPVTGVCTCKPNRSGRRCDQCQRTYFGDPQSPESCQPCDCDRRGSPSEICDARSGQCHCHPGVTGRKCNMCDRGTTGKLPHCQPCGECWTNWDKAIDQVIADMKILRNQTHNQLPPELKPVYDVIVNLVKQIELLPASNLTSERLDRLKKALDLVEQKLTSLNSIDGNSGKLPSAIATLMKLEDNQKQTMQAINKSEEKLVELYKTLEWMKEDAEELATENPQGAYAALMAARQEIDRTRAILQGLERRQNLLNELQRKTIKAVETRSNADEDLRKHTKQIAQRIKDLQLDIKLVNRGLCGENGRSPESSADQDVCPSLCGGAGCDPLTAEMFGLLEGDKSEANLISGHWNPSSAFGIISGCGAASGCDPKSSAQMKQLMTNFLDSQNLLGAILQRATRVNSLVAGVNASREQAISMYLDSATRYSLLKSRIEYVQSLTDQTITEARRTREAYSNLTLARYNQLIKEIHSLQHTTTPAEAIELGNRLEAAARNLEYEVKRIMSDSADERAQIDALLERAKRVREKAQSFLEQIKELAEANRILDELDKNDVFTALKSPDFVQHAQKLEDDIGMLQADVDINSREIRLKSDLAKQNAEKAQNLLKNVKDAHTGAQISKQSLQTLENTFTLLDEKMEAINEEMNKFISQGGGNSTSGDPDDDSSDLAKEVEIYIQNLQNSLDKLNGLQDSLNNVETVTGKLNDELEGVVRNVNEYSDAISKQTKQHRFCT